MMTRAFDRRARAVVDAGGPLDDALGTVAARGLEGSERHLRAGLVAQAFGGTCAHRRAASTDLVRSAVVVAVLSVAGGLVQGCGLAGVITPGIVAVAVDAGDYLAGNRHPSPPL